MDELLRLDSVSAGYGPIEALKAICLSVRKGEIVTLIGANGAGKSTTLRCISGVLQPNAGTISFAGHDITATPAHELVSRGMAHVPEGRRVFPRLTVTENLQLGGFSVKDPTIVAQRVERACDLFPILRERRTQAAGTLSGGEQQMLAIARALISSPSLLLLDEPSMGVAPIFVEKIFETVVSLNREGVTILLVEQNAHLALQIAARGYVIETGSIILEDTGAALLKNPQVQEAYLGE